jgi:hypothetical protein
MDFDFIRLALRNSLNYAEAANDRFKCCVEDKAALICASGLVGQQLDRIRRGL